MPVRKALCAALALLLLFTLIPLPRARAEEPKLIAFTFDDGPSGNTPALLDGLEARGIAVTFFMTGDNGGAGAVNHYDLLTRMAALGCQLANHSYSHSNFKKLKAEQIKAEVEGVETWIYTAAGGAYDELVRIPGGSNTPLIRETVERPLVTWSVDPQDWKYRDADIVYQNIMDAAKDGAIVLLHDLYQSSIEGGLRAMDSLREAGYEFVTVSELFRRRGVTMEAGTVYSSAPNRGVSLPGYQAPVMTEETAGDAISVRLSAADEGLTLRYTTDGSLPTLASPVYTGPLILSKTTTLRAAGFDRFATRTPVAERTIDIRRAALPKISYVANDGRIVLRSSTKNSTILYTVDGSDPRVSGLPYTGAFTPGRVTRAVAAAEGCLRSEVAAYTLLSGGALFCDLPPDAWYFPAVESAVARGLMSGMGDFVFSPEKAVTRAELTNILYRLAGSPDTETGAFPDVPENAWYAAAVSWAARNGILSGTGDGRLGPDDALSVEQAAVLVERYAALAGRRDAPEADLSAYPDAAQISDYARAAMAWCVGAGLLGAAPDGTLGPGNTASRGQCAVMISAL